MVALLILLGLALALTVAPFELARIRLAGVGIFWWYAIVVAPSVAAALAIPLLHRESD
jgi:hypothetical protein